MPQASALGMVAQEIFSKKDKDGCKKSTHLVCQSPEGKKYEAAIKWKLPVVSCPLKTFRAGQNSCP